LQLWAESTPGARHDPDVLKGITANCLGGLSTITHCKLQTPEATS